MTKSLKRRACKGMTHWTCGDYCECGKTAMEFWVMTEQNNQTVYYCIEKDYPITIPETAGNKRAKW